MTDTLTREQRSERMSRIRGKDSKPEMLVRSLLHRLGFRFRLHHSKLPGKPDIVLPRHKKIILVHGCYWHRHGVCRPLSIPVSNSEFWRMKFESNILRDRRIKSELKAMGWDILVIWECETRIRGAVEPKILKFLKKLGYPKSARAG